jgi:hypothetical protein
MTDEMRLLLLDIHEFFSGMPAVGISFTTLDRMNELDQRLGKELGLELVPFD